MGRAYIIQYLYYTNDPYMIMKKEWQIMYWKALIGTIWITEPIAITTRREKISL